MQRKWQREWERSKASQREKGVTNPNSTGNPLKTLAKHVLVPLAAAGILLTGMTGAYATNSTDGTIINGAGTITQNGKSMTITQNTDKLGINWRTFNIATGEKVQFIQPSASSIALNRVIGNDASAIYGTLTANGKVFLINPNGILFAPGAKVDVGGLAASSLNISDSDFMTGKYKFTGQDTTLGAVVNQGTITAANGGYVALLGSDVKNEGIIVANKGTVALAAGKAVTLDMNGDKLLSLAVDQAALDAGAANHNLIQADGGQVIIAAKAANTLARTVVNNSGIIQAQSVNNVNGEIILDGGTNGLVANSGTLDASGKNAGATGGTVKVLGSQVALTDTAKVDVSGTNGGGTALIGGNAQGKGAEQNATTTTVAKGATINADATTAGNGGKVVVWADDTTNYYGNISAAGGSVSGNGGNAEVSGKKTLLYKGYTDLRAPNGTTGTLLLDPGEYTISTGATSGNIYNVTELGTQLNSANVTLATDGTGTGDITVAADVTNWTSGNTLTLKANNDINVNANVKSTGSGNVVLRADSDADSKGTVNFGNSGKVITDGAVSIYYNPSGTTTTTINGAATTVKDYKNPKDYSSYVQKTAGGTGNLTAYMLVNNVNELQAVSNNLSGVYALGKDIDASATLNWNSGAGFVPIGIWKDSVYNPKFSKFEIYDHFDPFGGIFDGDGHAINGLYINSDSTATANQNIGLFVGVGGNGGIIRNLGLKNVNITSRISSGTVGGLAGYMNSGTITNCYVTGTIVSNNSSYYGIGRCVGGLVGSLDGGNITNSFSAVAIQGTNVLYVGSLVGYSVGSIDKCYATGSVNVSNSFNDDTDMGGLVGYNEGSIKNSYSTSAVTANSWQASSVGGLVGRNNTINGVGSIENCYSTGAVVTGNPGFSGGLVGWMSGGQIASSYSTGAVNGSAGVSGGLVGSMFGGQITSSYSTSAVTNGGWSSGGLVGYIGNDGSNNITITGSYSAGKVTGSDGSLVGGFVGYTEGEYCISGSYWDIDTSGQQTGSYDGSSIDGLTGLSAAGSDPYKAISYNSSFNFDKTWYMVEGYTRPFLQWEYSTTITNAHQLQLMAKDLSEHYTLAGNIDMSGNIMARSGFMPIGSRNTPFTGALNGNGYAVNGLVITNPASAEVGLFGYIKDAAISNVGLYDANITGGATSAYVGSLVGYNSGGSISNVYSTGAVSGYGTVGGLVGLNDGIVTTSYTTSQVTGSGSNGKVGGLAGENDKQITNSYSTGQVTGDAGSSVGGFIGYSGSDSKVTDSYWDKETSGQAEGVGSGSNSGVTGLTTAQMMDKAYLAEHGFDFTKTWFMIDGHTRPFLRSENVSAITNAHQLQLMAADLNADYILGSNIGMSELTRASGMWNTTTGFASIGSSDTPFTGTLDGAGYTINGLMINDPAAAAVGLFGYVKNATISSIGLCDVNITGGADNTYVGSLAGYNDGGSISNVYITGTVSGVTTVGGLVGLNNGDIVNSYNAGMVSGTGNIGGLAGLNNGIMINSYNAGMVSGTGNIGGLAGTNAGSIANSYNKGTVETIAGGAGSKVGGLTGSNTGSITGSYNAAAGMFDGTTGGTVNGNADKDIVGGLAGESDGSITNSYNAGIVNANAAGSTAGGLAGINTGDITGSYNADADWMNGTAAGTVTSYAAETTVGGLVGENDGTLTASYNKGVVITNSSNTILGGLVGKNKKTITGSYNTSALTNNLAGNIIGGLVGENYGTIKGDSYNTGAITTTVANSAIGGLVSKNYGSIIKSYNTGVITSDAADNAIGGLVGENLQGGSLINSYNAGAVATTVNAADNWAGGLAGKNYSTITGCYNAVLITAAGDGNRVGGLVGLNALGSSIDNSYNSTFMLTAGGSNNIVGGLVGENDGDISYSYTITPLTATGSNSTVGALVGLNGSTGKINNGYWNTEIAGQPTGVGSGSADSVKGLTIAEMMQRSTYDGWDLTNTWNIVNGTSFPYLTWQFDGTPKFITGTVQGGGSGKTVAIDIYDTDQYFHQYTTMVSTLKLTTIAANGFYYMTVPSSLTVPENALLLTYVSGDSNYKANALYRYGSNGVTSGNLIQNTLIVNGGSIPVSSIPMVQTADDSVFSSPDGGLLVNGDFQAYNFLCTPESGTTNLGDQITPNSFNSLTATGSITIINPASEYANFGKTDGLSDGYRIALSDVDEIRTHITAGGDITYITDRNLLISKGGQFSAGGNVTLVANKGFLNNGGTDVLKLGSGRWLVYAPDQLLDRSSRLFYEQPKYSYLLKEYYSVWADYFKQYLSGVDQVYDGRGGLTGSFTQWGTTYGEAVPATGNGFVYSALTSALRPLTPSQARRSAAITEAYRYNAQRRGLGAATTRVPSLITSNLPFLTVNGTGVALAAVDASQITVEQQTESVNSAPGSEPAAPVAEK